MKDAQHVPAVSNGNVFGDINALRRAGAMQTGLEDEDAAERREREKFDETTCVGRVATSKPFEYITLGVIVINALYIGYDSDYEARWGKPDELYKSSLWGFMLMDNLFCTFFTIELLIRFFAYKTPVTCCTDRSFIFDFLLVALMIAETWVLEFVGSSGALKQVSILRLLRLTRLLRMGKIMRYFPELQLIVKGMVAAIRSVACAAALLFLVMYVFAIIFTSEYHQGLKADDDPDIPEIEVLFGSLGKSMRHLFIMATILDDITACTNAIRSTEKMTMLFAFFVCVVVGSFTIFNMLLGILCEVVEATKESEERKAEERALHNSMVRVFKTLDLDGNGRVTRSEFLKMKDKEELMDILEKLDIDRDSFDKYADLLFMAEKRPNGKLVYPSLDYNQIVSLLSRLRPGTTVSLCDFRYFSYEVKENHKMMNRYIESIERLLEAASRSEPIADEVVPFHTDVAHKELPVQLPDFPNTQQMALPSSNQMALPSSRQVLPSSQQMALPSSTQLAFANHPAARARRAEMNAAHAASQSKQSAAHSPLRTHQVAIQGARQKQSIVALARSEATQMANPPARVASRWDYNKSPTAKNNGAGRGRRAQGSTSPTAKTDDARRAERKREEQVASRLSALAERRRQKEIEVRSNLYQSSVEALRISADATPDRRSDSLDIFDL